MDTDTEYYIRQTTHGGYDGEFLYKLVPEFRYEGGFVDEYGETEDEYHIGTEIDLMMTDLPFGECFDALFEMAEGHIDGEMHKWDFHLDPTEVNEDLLGGKNVAKLIR